MKTRNRVLASAFGLLMVVLCGIVLTACDQSVLCMHEWGEYTVIENATCSKPGIQARTCVKCGKSEMATLEKADHVSNVDDGDYVIMLSDGVSQSTDDATWLLEMLAKPPKEDVGEYADEILAAAIKHSHLNDDMTVVVAKVVKAL